MIYSESKLLNKKVSRLGFGTCQIGGPATFGGKQIGMGNVDQKEAINSINYAMENGINFFDTADIYGNGLSETLLGKALGPKINDAVICTKFGNREISKNKSSYDFSSSWLEKALNGSLKRLKREYVDILMMHSPPDDFDWNKYDFTPLEKFKNQGKIISYGVSCHSYRGAERLLKYQNITALEVIYNIIDRRIEEKVLQHKRSHNLSIIARVPLCMGYLSNKILDKYPDYEPNDFRSTIKKEHSDWIIKSVKKLSFLKNIDLDLSSTAIRFCISNNKITTVIPGMRNTNQVKKNIAAERLGPLEKRIVQKIKTSIDKVHPDW